MSGGYPCSNSKKNKIIMSAQYEDDFIFVKIYNYS